MVEYREPSLSRIDTLDMVVLSVTVLVLVMEMRIRTTITPSTIIKEEKGDILFYFSTFLLFFFVCIGDKKKKISTNSETVMEQKPSNSNTRTSARTEFLSQNDIGQLLDNEQTDVYEWKYNTIDPEKILKSQDVATIIYICRKRFAQLRKANPDKSDDEIRETIQETNESIRSFATETHPKIFQTICDRDLSIEVFKNLMIMVNAQRMIETGKHTREEVEHSLQNHFMKPEITSDAPLEQVKNPQ